MNQKEKIIAVTTELINENQGDLNMVTARKIADRAKVGLGLINYHFGSKERLITECVQKIINEQIRMFTPNDTDGGTSVEDDERRLRNWAKQVFEFFYDNRSVSIVSILEDMKSNQPVSNTLYTQKGFERAFYSDMEDKKKKLLIFTLTSTMESAFLQDELVKNRLGFDLSKKKEREKYIDSLIDILF